MRRVVWAQSALDDLDSGLAYLAARDPQAAVTLAERLDEAARKLGLHPTGRPGRVEGTWEKPVARTSYVIAYALGDDTIAVLRVIHTARDWPEGAWPDADG